MNDIEQKALAVLNEVRKERDWRPITKMYRSDAEFEPLCRAIERHEAFKQEVSDKVEKVIESCAVTSWGAAMLDPLIIPKPKPDPLMEVIETLDSYMWTDTKGYVECFHKALKDHGLEVREKGK